MATWRRRDLARRDAERSARMARLFKLELVVAVVALIVAAVSLWQAMQAQSRADLLAHDLSVADTRLRAARTAADLAPAARGPGRDDADASIPPLPPGVGPSPSPTP